jgi:hypothetical protein
MTAAPAQVEKRRFMALQQERMRDIVRETCSEAKVTGR